MDPQFADLLLELLGYIAALIFVFLFHTRD